MLSITLGHRQVLQSAMSMRLGIIRYRHVEREEKRNWDLEKFRNPILPWDFENEGEERVLGQKEHSFPIFIQCTYIPLD